MVQGVRSCGTCGAAMDAAATHCGQCGAPATPPAFAPAPAYQVAAAVPHKTAGPAIWALAAGGVAFFGICLAVAAHIFATAGSGGQTDCPRRCSPPPPKSPPLSAPHTYTSKDLGWSVDYYDPQQALAGAFSVTHQDSGSITWTLVGKRWPGNWPITFQGEKAAGRSPGQIADQLQQASFKDARRAYSIPGAELGYADGYGGVYDITFSQATGTSQRARLVIMVAVRGDVAVVQGHQLLGAE